MTIGRSGTEINSGVNKGGSFKNVASYKVLRSYPNFDSLEDSERDYRTLMQIEHEYNLMRFKLYFESIK